MLPVLQRLGDAYGFYLLLLLLIVTQKEMLKHALSRLPAPRNDYEIVVPDSESHMDGSTVYEHFIPDQADVEANREAELRAKSECTKFDIMNHLH